MRCLPLERVEKKKKEQRAAFKKRLEMFKEQIDPEKPQTMSLRAPLPSAFPFQESTLGKDT